MAFSSSSRETRPSDRYSFLEREAKRQRTNMEIMEQIVHPASDAFKRHFDIPSLPSNLVFDFNSFDDANRASTPESILLNSVLNLRSQGSWQGASALGTHGMGGVGKTTALKAICSSKNVQSQFEDGICFMEFGQDATVQKVRAEISRCVKKFGGKKVAKEMKNAANLGDVVSEAADWFEDRTVLFVCDDLWATEDSELGYVFELKKMLRDAPKSGLLISTRDRVIANAVSDSPVNFECAEPQGSRAKNILGKAAFGDNYEEIISNWDVESEFVEILRVCAGLPLALGIAGSGVKLNYEDSKNPSFSIVKYWRQLERGGLNRLKGVNVEYHTSGLKYVVEASLQLCELWGSSGGRNMDMRRFFRSLCVLEKQQLIPESTLEQYWDLDELQVGEVVEKFTNLNIVKRVATKRSTGTYSEGSQFYDHMHEDPQFYDHMHEDSLFYDDMHEDSLSYDHMHEVSQFYVHMHDLVLGLCQEMVAGEEEEWHLKLVNSYRLTLEDDKEMGTQRKDWWNVKDDGCVYENLSRHLVASGLSTELESLLCDIRWTLRRHEMGGWVALDLDFKRLLADQGSSQKHGIRKLHLLLKRCWSWLRSDRSLFAFYIFGHLSKQEREERYVSEYLKSVTEHFPSPWLYPIAKCVRPEDNRERSRWNFGSRVFDLAVSWSSDRVVITSHEGIYVWSLSRQEELFRISVSSVGFMNSVALSEDAKIIVSSRWIDGTIYRWNGRTGMPIGEPMSGHAEAVAFRGNLIVSGSDDGLLYRWNATTGESLGNPLKGHEDRVIFVEVIADGQLIVSGSRDGTIRRWDANNGDPVGSPLKAHHTGVTSLAISSDGDLLVSGHDDGTVRRWKASTGDAVGGPLRGHKTSINDIAVSVDGKHIVSCSRYGDVRLWDAASGEAIGMPLRGHGDSATCVAVSRDCKLVLSGSDDGSVRQWDVSAERNVTEQQLQFNVGDELGFYLYPKRITSLSVCANGKLAVSGSEDGTVQRWDMLTGEAVGRPMLGHAEDRSVSSVAISRDGTLIVSGYSYGMVRRWDGSTGLAIGEPMEGHSWVITAIVISDDGKLIITGSYDTTIMRWGSRTGKAIGKPMEGHSEKIGSLAISTDGDLIVSGAHDGIMRRWDAGTGEQIGDDIEGPRMVDKIVISKDGETIASGSKLDDYVQKWETKTGRPTWEHSGRGKHILDEMERARLCGDQYCDAVGREDTFPIEMTSRAVCPDKKKIVLGLNNGSVVVCERR